MWMTTAWYGDKRKNFYSMVAAAHLICNVDFKHISRAKKWVDLLMSRNRKNALRLRIKMLSRFFLPLEHFGVKFDRAMTLYEFDALREPEKTQFPLIGDFVRKHVEMVKIPTPQVLIQEPLPFDRISYMPDFFISNKTRYYLFSKHAYKTSLHPSKKASFRNHTDYEIVSLLNHPGGMHELIEKFCQKVCGLSTANLVAKYHRAVWCPLYWPESLGTDWKTEFWYPRAGYAGRLAELVGTNGAKKAEGIRQVEIRLAYCLARVSNQFSVLFVPELRRRLPDHGSQQSPIYRITDQDVCAGTGSETHRLVVEYRGECDVAADLAVLGITVERIAYGTGKIVPPTRENVDAGYDFGRNMNSMLWEYVK